ncbi:hypothetical protein DsansV1_C02g0016621 [Dioscorea sansibarensis]
MKLLWRKTRVFRSLPLHIYANQSHSDNATMHYLCMYIYINKKGVGVKVISRDLDRSLWDVWRSN